MKAKKTKYTKFFSLPIVSIIVVFFVLISFMSFAKNIVEISRENSEEKLEESVEYISKFIVNNVGDAVGIIEEENLVVFQEDGKIIINSFKEKSTLYEKDDLWSILENTSFEEGYSYLSFRQDVSSRKSGFIRYSDNGDDRLGYYSPVGINKL